MVAKNNIFLFLVFIFSYSFAQERLGTENFIPVNAPDITAFSQVNFLPISEYTGKPNISIPLYTIQLGSLTIPIGLTYNYGGIKVDAVASSVGTNWSLQAGGNVVRQVNGLFDFDAQGSLDGFGMLGYLASATSDCSQYMGIDGEPDLYLASAPGLNTKFIPVRSPGTPGTTNYGSRTEYKVNCAELNQQGNQIKMHAWLYNADLNLYPYDYPSNAFSYRFDVVATKIINTNGFVYNFSDFTVAANQSHGASWDINPTYPNQPVRAQTFISSHQLTSIYDPSTDKKIYFDYGLPYNQDEYYNNKGVFRLDGTIGSKNIQRNIFKNKRLSKIRFDEGEVEFFYNFSRLDLPTYENNVTLDNKALSRITVKDNFGNIIKDIRFVYSNVASKEGCTSVDCYRLFLDGVYFVGSQGTTLPGYTFAYNTLKLPKRLSYISDFLGYYNGEIANPAPTLEGHYIPKTYYKANQGKYSFLPFGIGLTGYQQLNGNYSLAPNPTYAKAGILEKITYPTGGYMILENESNEFKLLGQTIQGGGLRVSKQKLFDSNGSLEREITYEYKKANGSTSGSIVNLPKYNDYIFRSAHIDNGLRIFQTNMANQKTTESSYISYSRVKIKETGNGYQIKNFTSIEDFPNIIGNVTLPTSVTLTAHLRVVNGCAPSLVTDTDALRGKLIKQEVFTEEGILKQETINQYEQHIFDVVPISNEIRNTDAILNGDGCDPVPNFMSESANLNLERNMLINTQAISYNNDGSQITTQTSFTYDNDYPFIKEKTVVDSESKEQLSKFYFTNDINLVKPATTGSLTDPPTQEILDYFSAKNALDSLKSQNRVGELLKTASYEKINTIEHLLATQETVFKDWGASASNTRNIILPEFNTSAKGILTSTNKLEENVRFHKYDNKGNLIEASKADGTHIYFIWGYHQTKVIAKIENFTSQQAAPLLLMITAAVNASNADNDATFGFNGNEGILRNKLQLLRGHSSLSNAEMTSYTYDPLVGITSITDPRGQSIYYHYDEFNRLEHITDLDGNVVASNKYHLINQN